MGEKDIITDKPADKRSDNQLMAKLVDGDKTALVEIMRRYRVKAINFSYRFLGDFDEAEDAAQECFVKVYYNCRRFDLDRSFTPWFYTILTNCCRDRIRKKSLFSDMIDRFKTHNKSDSIQIENNQNENAELLKKALVKLSPSKREIITLRFTDDMSYQEIAETLGISQGTVMSRLFRAKKELENILKKMGVFR